MEKKDLVIKINPNLEEDLSKFIKSMVKSRKKLEDEDGQQNKGFYYYLCLKKSLMHYGLGGGSFGDTFDEITKKGKFENVRKIYSRRYANFMENTDKAIEAKAKNSLHIIETLTLGSMPLIDFLAITEGLSDFELLQLIRGKEYVEKYRNMEAFFN